MTTLTRTECTGAPTTDERPDWPVLLCVDDDPSFIAAMERQFRPYQVHLQPAYHGMQGIVAAVSECPDVIITDLQMPLASGEELIECLTCNPATRHTPIIVVTGGCAAGTTSQLKRGSVAAVLSKPFPFEELLDEVRRFADLEPRSIY